ncbi:MAG TPA: PQQ-binding-like beta-propeller repeat protein, partial [Candidatus Limnocylindrales bacterium]|nr:PQQ-binding-like beta-propeller repeat protein [Candidatus Limnocylindrales bacterium]
MKDTPRRGFLASLGMTIVLCAVAAFSPIRAQHSLAFARDKAAPLQKTADEAAPAQQETPAKQAGAREQNATNKAGEALYKQRCAACHDNEVPRAPNRAALKEMSAENIRFALMTGKMVVQAFGLSSSQIADLTEFLTGKQPAKVQFSPEAFCLAASAAAFADPLAKPHWNGWGGDLEQHRFQPAEMAQLSAEQVPKLKLKWAFGFPGVTRAFGQATVAGGRVFVGSAERKVYSLSAETGCIFWMFEADFPVRTAVSIGQNGSGWAAYFGDQHANAYAVDAATGKLLWKTSLESHPAAQITGAPALAGGKLFVPVSSVEEVFGGNPQYECCKFRGSVSALDAVTGKILWKGYTVTEEPKPVRKNKLGVQLWGPSGAGVWSSPTVDLKTHTVYVTTGDSYSDPAAETSDAFLAFDADTGKLKWSQQMTKGDAFNLDCGLPAEKQNNCPETKGPDFDFGSSPILVELGNGRRALIAGQKSGIVYALDPDKQGELLWQRRVGRGSSVGGVQWGSAVDQKSVYVAVSDLVMKPVAPGTPGAQDSVFGNPFQVDPKTGGGLFALKLDTGEIVWHTPHPGCNDKPGCSPAQSA